MAIAVAGGILHMRAAGAVGLAGTDLGRQQAPDFLLRDSGGQAYSLSRFRGKVVVLAFLYTQCPDVCPFTAELLRKADAAAGHPADVEYVAVSVDPIHDNAATIATFSEEHQLGELGNRFHYLIGSLPELARVWQRYEIRNAEAPESRQQIDHEASVYLIDRHGLRRQLVWVNTPVAAFARSLRALARE
ncbi:MAG TPA: SCO family protein [Dehalococcoidia bacterium]